MIDLTRVHEKETFRLKGGAPLAWPTIEQAMTGLGFDVIDDSAHRFRDDCPEKWQPETVASCHFELGEKDIYPDEGSFDTIRYEILVAWLPPHVIDQALEGMFALSEMLRLPVFYGTQSVCRNECETMKDLWLSDILAEIGDAAGSESAAILIQMEYERRWSQTAR